MEADKRAALSAVAAALRPLHKALIDVTTVAYEEKHGPVSGPSMLFQLLVHDPYFAWLRPMSGLMADIDALLDEEGPVGAEGIRARVETLISGEGAARYLQVLQDEPDVVMFHAALRRVLANL